MASSQWNSPMLSYRFEAKHSLSLLAAGGSLLAARHSPTTWNNSPASPTGCPVAGSNKSQPFTLANTPVVRIRNSSRDFIDQ